MSSQSQHLRPTCGKCQESNRKKIIVCAQCDGPFHLTCVGIKQKQAQELPTWTCASCFRQQSSCASQGSQPLTEEGFMDYFQKFREISHPVKRIPKGARSLFARGLVVLIRDIIREDSAIAWQRLTTFPAIVLSPPESKSSSKSSLTSLIKKQIESFLEHESLHPLKENPQSSVKQSNQRTPIMKLKRCVDAKFAEGDVKGAIQLLSSKSRVAEPNADSLHVMLKKHPTAPDDLDLPAPPYPCSISVTAKEVIDAICSFPNGSSGGPDGLRPQHLKDACSHTAGDAAHELVEALRQLLIIIGSKGVHQCVRSSFFGARLIALTKPNGDLRPIAVGSTLRRLTAKVLLAQNLEKFKEYLAPHQVGVGVRLGCEAAVHAVRGLVSELRGTKSNKVALKLDLSNAFNNVRRDKVLQRVKSEFPDIYPFAWATYCADSSLFFGNSVICSQSGVQQGDPLGPALFALTIHEAVKQNTGLDINVWYLDDGTLIGDADVVKLNTSRLIQELHALGLSVNPRKCELYPMSDNVDTQSFNDVIDGIKVMGHEDFDLLGAPITEEAQANALKSKTEHLDTLLENLDHIDQHQAFYLLVNYLSIPKLIYLLRSSPVYSEIGPLQDIDHKVSQKLEDIGNIKLEESSRRQASLPVKRGGIGLRSCKDLALPSYLASVNACSSLAQQIAPSSLPNSREWQNAHALWELQNPMAEVKEKKTQRSWDEVIIKEQEEYIMNGDQYCRARLNAAAAEHSGAWLTALPHSNIGTLLSPEELRVAVALRLGCIVCESGRCRCGSPLDKRGLHGLSCRLNAGRYSRHSSLNNLVKKTLQRVNIPAILEPRGLSRTDGKRPDGVTLIPWKHGKAMVWDVTVTDTFCNSSIIESALEAGKAAAKAEELKINKYHPLKESYYVQPVAFETSGAWGPATKTFIKDLKRKLTQTTGDHREAGYLAAAISIAITRGNAASVLACLQDV